jgi:hypothetical protein
LPQPLEVSGLFSGVLDFTPNKMDMDITISLYERLPSGYRAVNICGCSIRRTRFAPAMRRIAVTVTCCRRACASS